MPAAAKLLGLIALRFHLAAIAKFAGKIAAFKQVDLKLVSRKMALEPGYAKPQLYKGDTILDFRFWILD
jgi:hypothetical protein